MSDRPPIWMERATTRHPSKATISIAGRIHPRFFKRPERPNIVLADDETVYRPGWCDDPGRMIIGGATWRRDWKTVPIDFFASAEHVGLVLDCLDLQAVEIVAAGSVVNPRYQREVGWTPDDEDAILEALKPPSPARRMPSPNAVAYDVTARRGPMGRPSFRRVGLDFRVGEKMRVAATALTPAQREFLLNSDPAELEVVEIGPQEVAETGPQERAGGRRGGSAA